MSRKITLTCQMEEPELLAEAMADVGAESFEAGPNVMRFRTDDRGFVLLYGGLTLTHTEEGFYRASYDEDCSNSKRLLGLLTQNYAKHKFLRTAMQEGDQIRSEYIATGEELDPLIEKGDIVIVATKGA